MRVPKTFAILFGSLASTDASAQSALVIQDELPWGYDAIQDALAAKGIPYDVIGEAQIGVVDPFLYTMIFVSSCQPDSLYTTWNNNLAGKFEPWIASGGFAVLNGCVDLCGITTGNVFPQPPGAPVSHSQNIVDLGNTVDPLHPLMLNVAAAPFGTSLAHTGITNTGDPNDTVLITGKGDVLYFERVHGQGIVIVSTLTSSYGFGVNSTNPPPNPLQDAGIVMINEVEYGLTFNLCGELDDDLDGVGNDCDVCPGFDDTLDADGDLVPNDCDACPLADPDDEDGDGICGDVDDSDGDGFFDIADNCYAVANLDQVDTDADGSGDACDNCTAAPNQDQADADYDDVGDVCDICDGSDDEIDPDGDLLPSGCDICPDDADPLQKDADRDGHGDSCDCDSSDPFVNPGEDEVCDGVDNDCDGVVDGENALDATLFFEDADLDGQGNPNGGSILGCEPPEGYADNVDDCDDTSRHARKGASEVCDGIDNDCDGEIDGEECVEVAGDTDGPAVDRSESGCSGCTATQPGPTAGWLLLAGVGLLRRRR